MVHANEKVVYDRTDIEICQEQKFSDITLNEFAYALVNGMSSRGDRHHHRGAYFGVNSGRVANIAKGPKVSTVNKLQRH